MPALLIFRPSGAPGVPHRRAQMRLLAMVPSGFTSKARMCWRSVSLNRRLLVEREAHAVRLAEMSSASKIEGSMQVYVGVTGRHQCEATRPPTMSWPL